MTDLTNRVQNLNVETLQALYQKYGVALQEISKKDDPKLPYYAYIINLANNYLQEKHKEESPSWKAWCVIVIKRLFDLGKLETKEDIFKHIDKFLEHKKSEYEKYVSNIALYSDEYYRDCYFIDQYTKASNLLQIS